MASFNRRIYILGLLITATLLLIIQTNINNFDEEEVAKQSIEANRDDFGDDFEDDGPSSLVEYDENTPLIWVGGVPRSGTTLMRVMLDAHEDIRCGEETHIIPQILMTHSAFEKSKAQKNRLLEANIDEDVLNFALGSYLLSVIVQHGELAPNLCNKDPFTLKYVSKLKTIFPKSKFLLMIRDGRATVHSIISRHVTIGGFDMHSYRGALEDWDRSISGMYDECMKNGKDVCMPVYYEQLVLHPESQMRNILEFLEIPWDETVLHHEETIGKENGVSLSKREPSTNQVNKPVNLEALTKWADYLPDDVKRDIDEIAPMLQKLGYDTHTYPPNYGEPDKEVLANSQKLEQDVSILDQWKIQYQ